LRPRLLGPSLRRLRQMRGLKQFELAARCDCTKAQVSAFERCRHFPRFPTLVRLLDGLGASFGDLDRAMRWADRQPEDGDL